MDRRRFLTALGTTAGATALLSACGAPGDEADVPDVEASLVLRQPSFELLVGDDRRYAFLLTDMEHRPVEAESVRVWVADAEEEPVAGPFEATFVEEEGLGIYRTFVDLPEAGTTFLLVAHDDELGRAAVEVVEPEDSIVPAPGQPAPASPTPTVDDDHGWAALCTRDPDCGMHDVGLEEALDEGRPTLLVFATPAYCQTAVCRPAVETVERVRTSRDWGEVAFVHVEIYTDAAQTLTAPVEDWGLPSEPWYFAIDRDGRIAERLDGPLVGADVELLLEAIS